MSTATLCILITSQARNLVTYANRCRGVSVKLFAASTRHVTRFTYYDENRDVPMAFTVSHGANGTIVMVGRGVFMFFGEDPFSFDFRFCLF